VAAGKNDPQFADLMRAGIDFEVHYLVQVKDGAPRVFGWIAGDEQEVRHRGSQRRCAPPWRHSASKSLAQGSWQTPCCRPAMPTPAPQAPCRPRRYKKAIAGGQAVWL